jgi:flagellar assembly protein FliH
MSFTYEEALAKLTVSLEPAMREIINKLLPEMVRAALGAHILEQVQGLLKTQVEQPVEILIHPQNTEIVQRIIGANLSAPFEIVDDKTLGAGQAFVRIGDSERQVDLDSLVSEVSKAMTAFFHESGSEAQHG